MTLVERPRPIPAQFVRARFEAGMSVPEVAEAAGCSVNSIWAYESGARTPTAKRMFRVAEVLGKPVAWFYSEAQAA